MPVSGGGSHYSWDHLYGYGKYGEVQETWGEYAERRLQEIDDSMHDYDYDYDEDEENMTD